MSLSRKLALICMSMLTLGCAAQSESCPHELGREDLLRIVAAEKARQTGRPDEPYERNVTITRDGCDYVYFEERLPATPGAHLMIRMDGRGKVV